MSNPTAVITGASRGIGRACARALAFGGWQLVLSGRNQNALAALAAALPGEGHVALAADLLTSSGRDVLLREIEKRVPEATVQCLGGRVPTTVPCDQWESTMAVNFHAVVAVDELIIPHLLARGSGTIVHLSSSAAVHGRAQPAYACAKAALNRYIVTRGRECLPRGVSISGLMPAAVEGDDNDWARARTADPERYARMCQGQSLGRPQTTDEVAAVVAFLCSPTGRLFGGCVLPADSALDT
ncbi:MAG TPA: SDR family oxidoreductase [Opitutaceae bacterium]|nr:SDR family oxidoreductase [Opitutaceae bacterium]